MCKAFICLLMLVCMMTAVSEHSEAAVFLYTDWEMLLALSVHDGLIDQTALEDNSYLLKRFLADVAALDRRTYETWSEKDRRAFWINVYNACALSLLLKDRFAEQLTELRGPCPDDPVFTVKGDHLSLNDIKNTYLRSMFRDERIVFALATPARSFPRLRREAYLGTFIDLMLEEDVGRYVRARENVDVTVHEKKVYLSPLFEWCGEDFIERYGRTVPELTHFSAQEQAVVLFLSAVLPQHQSFLMSGQYTIVYRDADWSIPRVST